MAHRRPRLVLELTDHDLNALDRLVEQLGVRMGFVTDKDARTGIARAALRQGLSWMAKADQEP